MDLRKQKYGRLHEKEKKQIKDKNTIRGTNEIKFTRTKNPRRKRDE